MSSTFIKGLTVFIFFGLIIFFVACKTGALSSKKEPILNTKMGGSKSVEIFIPDKNNTAAKDTVIKTDKIEQTKEEIEFIRMHSSKSAPVFEPSYFKVDTIIMLPDSSR